MQEMKVVPIPPETARQLISQYHYSSVMPKLTEVCYGGFIDNQFLATITLGWGVRPLHTIQKLFPDLLPIDYWEIGKMCLADELPRNSETYFMAKVMKEVKKNFKNKKLIFTWADGIMGKPGYVYQAANFYYGGFIWTDTYLTKDGEKVHPRTSQKLDTTNDDLEYGHRPTKEQLQKWGWSQIQGKQFRYAYFLQDEKKLLKASTVEWTRTKNNYPKDKDLEWKKRDENGFWIETSKPNFSKKYSVNKVKERSAGTQMSMF